MNMAVIDIETYSEVDLGKCGVYRYAEDPSFEILLLGIAFNDEPAEVFDLTIGELPIRIKNMLFDKNTLLACHNAAFERICLNSYLKKEIPINRFFCTMVAALSLSLPAALDDVGTVLHLGTQKDKAGKALIGYFCKPCKSTKINGMRTRNLPSHAPDKWKQFKSYCRQDVETERELYYRLQKQPMLQSEWEMYYLDQKINDTGIGLEMDLVNNALKLNDQISEILFREAQQLTGLENPNSVAQLKKWLELQGIEEIESLDKKAVKKLLNETEAEEVIKVLEIRQQSAKSSIKKYEAMNNCAGKDHRARGLFQFYGASRTGRWAGRKIQFQNLPQNHMKGLEDARERLLRGQFEELKNEHDNIPNVLSELLRTAIVSELGHKFLVSDFSAIEARVISWFAGEEWRLNVFRGDGKIYEATASKMFDIPIETIVEGHENYEYRQKGKTSELGCGFGGGVGALIRMGALEKGLKEEELQPLITAWRAANPKIVKLWYNLSDAAKKTIRTKKRTELMYGVEFSYESGIMFLRLPSGRKLAYIRPRIKIDPKTGYEEIWHETQEAKSWVETKTWHGTIVENLVQATSRDILAEAMKRIDEAGIKIVATCHDEVICEVQEDGIFGIEDLNNLMRINPIWTQVPLNASGFECKFYRKG